MSLLCLGKHAFLQKLVGIEPIIVIFLIIFALLLLVLLLQSQNLPDLLEWVLFFLISIISIFSFVRPIVAYIINRASFESCQVHIVFLLLVLQLSFQPLSSISHILLYFFHVHEPITIIFSFLFTQPFMLILSTFAQLLHRSYSITGMRYLAIIAILQSRCHTYVIISIFQHLKLKCYLNYSNYHLLIIMTSLTHFSNVPFSLIIKQTTCLLND